MASPVRDTWTCLALIGFESVIPTGISSGSAALPPKPAVISNYLRRENIPLQVTSGRTGRYWFGISDPSLPSAPLLTERPTQGSFGVQGAVQDYTITVDSVDPYAWDYQGVASASWEVRDPEGSLIASGPGGTLFPITFTPEQSGIYHLILHGSEGIPVISPGSIGSSFIRSVRQRRRRWIR